jgi:hypothetical protein
MSIVHGKMLTTQGESSLSRICMRSVCARAVAINIAVDNTRASIILLRVTAPMEHADLLHPRNEQEVIFI